MIAPPHAAAPAPTPFPPRLLDWLRAMPYGYDMRAVAIVYSRLFGGGLRGDALADAVIARLACAGEA